MTNLPGEISAALETDLTIDITTTGRRSGEPSRIEIWFVNVEGVIYITGTPGPRDWFANLAANSNFIFHLKESTKADLGAIAAVVTDLEERQLVLGSQAAAWYRSEDELSDLVQEAPLVRVTFRARADDPLFDERGSGN